MNYGTRLEMLKFVSEILDDAGRYYENGGRYYKDMAKSDGFKVPWQIADCLNNVHSHRRSRGPDIEIAAMETILELKVLGYLDQDKIDRMIEKEMIREVCDVAKPTTTKRRGL